MYASLKTKSECAGYVEGEAFGSTWQSWKAAVLAITTSKAGREQHSTSPFVLL